MEEMGSCSSPLRPNNLTQKPRSLSEKNDLSIRTKSLSSISSPSSSSSRMSSPFTPSSPFSSSSSAIPFSWESQPGIPKTSPRKPISPNPSPTLPLPPLPLRSSTSCTFLKKKQRSSYYNENGFETDPFAVALMECSKQVESWKMGSAVPPPPVMNKLTRRRRRGFGLMSSLDFYASCKTTCSVEDSNVHIPRAAPPNAVMAYGILHSRPP